MLVCFHVVSLICFLSVRISSDKELITEEHKESRIKKQENSESITEALFRLISNLEGVKIFPVYFIPKYLLKIQR